MPPEFFGVEVGQPFDVVLPLAIEPGVRGRAHRCIIRGVDADGHVPLEAGTVR